MFTGSYLRQGFLRHLLSEYLRSSAHQKRTPELTEYPQPLTVLVPQGICVRPAALKPVKTNNPCLTSAAKLCSFHAARGNELHVAIACPSASRPRRCSLVRIKKS